MNDFGTLLKSKNLKYEEKWCPSTVDKFEKILLSNILSSKNSGVISNICYSMQYLQYICFQIEQLNLHNIILLLLYKNFIIISMSIIEAIFYLVLQEKKLENYEERELIKKIKGNKTKIGDKYYIFDIDLYCLSEPQKVQMTFDTMIKKMKSNNILSSNPKIYKYLNKYRDSRNNVHLQNAITKHKSDFWQYQKGDYYVVKYMLYKILTDVNLFMADKNAECIKFLKLTKEEQIYTANYFKMIEKNEL